MGRILSVDFGLKRIGLGISDPLRNFAFPVGVVENKSLDYVISEIKKIVLEKEVDLIIVGLPLNMNHTKGEMAKKAEEFAKKLIKTIGINVEMLDERLSSFQAEENLKDLGLSGKQSKNFIDAEAARIILEEYLITAKKKS